MTQPDTAQRSLDHWSEAGRAEMQAFYALATEDYRQLAGARDWDADLAGHAVDGRVRLLDVACGSGKFPTALLAAGLPAQPVVDVDLLDPSAFSIAEARAALAPPFVAAGEHEVLLQDFAGTGYDVAWATHALYALPPAELAAGVGEDGRGAAPRRFRRRRAGVVALALPDVLRRLPRRRSPPTPRPTPTPRASPPPFARPARRSRCRCCTTAPGRPTAPSPRGSCSAARSTTRCRWTQMEASDALGDYLAGCRGPDGAYEFQHEAHLITWEQP